MRHIPMCVAAKRQKHLCHRCNCVTHSKFTWGHCVLEMHFDWLVVTGSWNTDAWIWSVYWSTAHGYAASTMSYLCSTSCWSLSHISSWNWIINFGMQKSSAYSGTSVDLYLLISCTRCDFLFHAAQLCELGDWQRLDQNRAIQTQAMQVFILLLSGHAHSQFYIVPANRNKVFRIELTASHIDFSQ